MERKEALKFVADVLTGHHEICTHNHYSDVAKAVNMLYDDFEAYKTCETCKQYSPWECTDGSTLSVGDCSFGIKFGKELVDDQYEWFVPYHFGCTEHTKKDTL